MQGRQQERAGAGELDEREERKEREELRGVIAHVIVAEDARHDPRGITLDALLVDEARRRGDVGGNSADLAGDIAALRTQEGGTARAV